MRKSTTLLSQTPMRPAFSASVPSLLSNRDRVDTMTGSLCLSSSGSSAGSESLERPILIRKGFSALRDGQTRISPVLGLDTGRKATESIFLMPSPTQEHSELVQALDLPNSSSSVNSKKSGSSDFVHDETGVKTRGLCAPSQERIHFATAVDLLAAQRRFENGLGVKARGHYVFRRETNVAKDEDACLRDVKKALHATQVDSEVKKPIKLRQRILVLFKK